MHPLAKQLLLPAHNPAHNWANKEGYPHSNNNNNKLITELFITVKLRTTISHDVQTRFPVSCFR